MTTRISSRSPLFSIFVFLSAFTKWFSDVAFFFDFDHCWIMNALKWKNRCLCFSFSPNMNHIWVCDATSNYSAEISVYSFTSLLVVCWLQNYFACYLTADSRIACFRLKRFFYEFFLCASVFFSFTQVSSKTEARKRKLNKWIKNGWEKKMKEKTMQFLWHVCGTAKNLFAQWNVRYG